MSATRLIIAAAMPGAPKNDLLTELRALITRDVPEAEETGRADIGLIELSFVSRTHRDRHVWISDWSQDDTTLLAADLEDWTYDKTWDNTVVTVESDALAPLVAAVRDWFAGAGAEQIEATHAARRPRLSDDPASH